MAQGIVYCLTNPEMPELVKIGRVDSADTVALKSRMKVLYSTGVPVPFELHYAVSVDNPCAVEMLLHETFGDSRENPRREFFRIAPERVVAAMKLTTGEEVSFTDSLDDDPDSEISRVDIDARERSRQRENKKLSSFQFSFAGIPSGAELTFSRDKSIVAKVLDSTNKILFEGDETTPSGAANIILKRYGLNGRVAGTLYWEYEGKTLDQIRRELEEQISEAA